MHDVIVIGGGFAGVTAAREAVQRGRSVLLLEARDRLGGRTWSADWDGEQIEYGGAYVHWHQPHTFAEITRAGLGVKLVDDAQQAAWWVGEERRTGTEDQRDEIARRGWDRFVEGAEEALPNPHDPLGAIEALKRFDRQSVTDRLDEIQLSEEERAVLEAELESVTSAPLQDSGAVAALRWHALSGFSLALTQTAGGRVKLAAPTRVLLESIASAASYDLRLRAPVQAVAQGAHGVEVRLRDGDTATARAAVLAVPLNTLDKIEFDPPLSEAKRAAIALGQSSRGSKIFIRARGEPVTLNTIRPGHAFGYLSTEHLDGDGSQLLLGFGLDAALCDARDRSAVQACLDAIVPGYEVLDATAHDWLADEFARGTWAVHRPGWYEHHHAAMRAPEGRILFAGSDLADGWAGFIDGAIESGLRAGAWSARLSD